MSPIHRECGYEIHRGDDEMLLVDRKTWLLGYVMSVLGALAVLLIVLGILDALDTADGLSGVPSGALFGLAAGLVVIVGANWRAYKCRRDLPLSQVVDGLIIDLHAGVLRDRQGNALSPLDRVCVAVRVDWWWTRALMRLVVLTWPGGKRVVFKTASRRRASEVAQVLVDAGVGEPPR